MYVYVVYIVCVYLPYLSVYKPHFRCQFFYQKEGGAAYTPTLSFDLNTLFKFDDNLTGFDDLTIERCATYVHSQPAFNSQHSTSTSQSV